MTPSRVEHDNDDALYTPVLKGTPHRLHLRVAFLAGFDYGSHGTKGVVRDRETGQHYLIEGKPCSATNADGTGCYCDAWATPCDPPIGPSLAAAGSYGAPEGTKQT